MSKPELGKIGLWSMQLAFGDKQAAASAAAEIEEMGFGAIWIPGGISDTVLEDVDALLAATSKVCIATGILNIWKHEPQQVAEWFLALPEKHRSRVLLGIGVSHGPFIGDAWKSPLSVVRAFLDQLEAADMPREHLCIAALGPKMLQLATERTAGSHPYLVNPEHTRFARSILGEHALLAPEQGIIIESEPDKARAACREALAIYAELPNYRNNWLRMGIPPEDIEQTSDRLIDELFAWGGAKNIQDRILAHQDAGADHVCVQIIPKPGADDISNLLESCREIADALL